MVILQSLQERDLVSWSNLGGPTTKQKLSVGPKGHSKSIKAYPSSKHVCGL